MLMERLKQFKRWLQGVVAVFKVDGLRGVIRQYGWKVLGVFFCYYLIRDSILYLLIPFLVFKGFWSSP